MLPTPDAFDCLDFIFEGDPGDRDGSRVAVMICLQEFHLLHMSLAEAAVILFNY